MISRIKDIYDYRDMIYSLVKRELRGRYQKSVLGMLWTFLNPFFQILIYTLVFTYIFPSSIENYYIYLMTGIIPWNFFTEALGQGAGRCGYDKKDLLPERNPHHCFCNCEICQYGACLPCCVCVFAVFACETECSHSFYAGCHAC